MFATANQVERFDQLYQELLVRHEEQEREHLARQLKSYGKYLKIAQMTFQKTPGYQNAKLLKDITKPLNEFASEFEGVAKGLDEPFMLFAMGMGKYGKSTLLNALMEQELAMMDELPKTWKIDVFNRHIPKNQAILVFKDGRKTALTKHDAEMVIQGEEKKRLDSEKLVNKMYKEVMRELKTVIEKKEYKQYLSQNHLYESDVTEVHWGVEQSALLKDFYLVDTPGVSQKIMGEMKVNIQEYYHKADGVLWLLDATVISAGNSRKLLEELDQSLEAVGGKAENMIGVLNRIDVIRERGGEESVQQILQEANEIYQGVFEAIIPISAKEAFEGLMSDDKHLVEQSGVTALNDVIKKRFLQRSKQIQIARKVQAAQLLANRVKHHFSGFKQRLTEDEARKSEQLFSLEEELVEKTGQFTKRINTLINQYQRSVQANIDRYAEQLFDIEGKDSQRHFLEDRIFESESLARDINALQQQAREQMDTINQHYLHKLWFKEYQHLDFQALPHHEGDTPDFYVGLQAGRLDTDGISFASGTGIALIGAAFLGPIGLLLGGIAGALGLTKWIAKQFKLGGLKSDLKGTLTESANKVATDLQQGVQDLARHIGNSLGTFSEESFSSLYGPSEEAERIMVLIKEVETRMDKQVEPLSVKELILQDRLGK